MQYFETELLFNTILSQDPGTSKSISADKPAGQAVRHGAEVLGITVRIGNKPLVYRLKEPGGNKDHPGGFLQDPSKDYYLVVHAIGALRTQGKARIDELQYTAVAADADNLRTIDLVPNSRFMEVARAGAKLEGSLSVTGEASLDIPAELAHTLLPQFIDIGGNIKLQLSGSAGFIAKFSFSIQLPVVQAVGIASNACTWVLNPDEKRTPLLGDQLLFQSIMVPKGTKAVTYKISGLVKADKGLFWKQKQQQTPEYQVEVQLSSPE